MKIAIDLKEPVSLEGLQPETLCGMLIADGVYKRVTGEEMTLTSVTDGVHSEGSLHPKGRAFDSRTRFSDGLPWPQGMIERLISELKKALGGKDSEFDVVKEDNHLHTEFDPKR